jgi:hypothetical protein
LFVRDSEHLEIREAQSLEGGLPAWFLNYPFVLISMLRCVDEEGSDALVKLGCREISTAEAHFSAFRAE